MLTATILLFISGYTIIALEHQLGINKTATALVLGMLLWTLCIFTGPDIIISANSTSFHEYIAANPPLHSLSLREQAIQYLINLQIIDHLGNIAEILFYLLGAMTIVEIIDTHHGFDLITKQIKTKNKKKLLWLIAFITFFMSAVLDNLTTAMVMVMLLRRLISDQTERWIFGSIVILAANAGGTWTPIGDVTTIMLWIHDNITAAHIMKQLLFPSLISIVIPLIIVSFRIKGNTTSVNNAPRETGNNLSVSHREQLIILLLGIICLLFVPVFKSTTHLPPFVGILLALGMLWIYLEILYNRKKTTSVTFPYRVSAILSKIDYSTLLFFLGILLSVAALQTLGVLNHMAAFLNEKLDNIYLIDSIIGLLSSIIDNVPLVAAAMGMYPLVTPDTQPLTPYLMNFVTNGTFWELLAYCAGVGGSILIIGSAAGVVVMGLERINFVWYLKHITWIALLGYLGGIAVYILQKSI
ncbi:sodium:proton antiporter NhaD [uncultured Sanguibacteroides sp.]|uniref:sodium:proton antiporter NhaD n=1 Tax=uncultured Sanguibacteroides sp. TaxID=1635151 RepID=UPI0025D07E6F|nr:sodium:proton antiporter NhaD [uncultured Sanguibacteroides sp.]